MVECVLCTAEAWGAVVFCVVSGRVCGWGYLYRPGVSSWPSLFPPRTLEVFSGKELLSFYFPFSRILDLFILSSGTLEFFQGGSTVGMYYT